MAGNYRNIEDMLYVGNLPFSTDEDDLRKVFTSGGRKVRDVKVVTNYKSGRSRGFAFVKMASPDEADQALELDGTELEGRRISVGKGRERVLRRR